jgi:hypothetical protein
LLVLQAVVAIVFAVGGAEAYLRAHPNVFTIVPKYASLDAGSVSLWFDIGLFTDPFDHWPLSRLTIIFAIGCFVYTTISLLVLAARRVCGGATVLVPQENGEVPRHDPPLVRLLMLIGIAVLVIFGMATLTPPLVR